MLIVLDSNILISDFFLNSHSSIISLQHTEELGLKIIIPVLVFEETVENFVRNREKLKNEFSRFVPPEENAAFQNLINFNYREFLNDIINKYKISIIDYPETPLKEIAQRAIGKRKPFKKGGKGFRDTVIWHSVLQLLTDKKENVVFVTNNYKDFATETGEFHPELVCDIPEDLKNKLTILPSLHRVAERYIYTKLQYIEELYNELYDNNHRHISIPEIIKEIDVYDQENWVFEENDVVAHVSKIESIPNFDISDVRRLSDGKIHVEIDAHAMVELSISNYSIDHHFWINGEDLYLGASLILDSKAKKLLSIEIGYSEIGSDLSDIEWFDNNYDLYE